MLIAENVIELGACRATLSWSATLVDESEPQVVALFAETQAAKAFVNEGAARIVDRALATSGGAGYLNGHPLSRAYRDVRAESSRNADDTDASDDLDVATNVATAEDRRRLELVERAHADLPGPARRSGGAEVVASWQVVSFSTAAASAIKPGEHIAHRPEAERATRNLAVERTIPALSARWSPAGGCP